MNRYYLCMEIGGTNLRYGVVTQNFQLVEFEKTATSELSDAEDKGSYIAGLMARQLEKYGRENILCLSLSLASLMDRERTVCYNSPNIKGFDNLPLKAVLEKKLKMPVYMERDVNTSLLYEIWKNNMSREGIIIGIYIGTGLGNAMCIDGKVYRGNTGASCELGHIPVPGLKELCGCGKAGCIELKACGKVLARIAEENYQCPVADIFRKYGDRQEVREVVEMCALAAAAEITILDPVEVILGGGVVEIPEFPMEYFSEIVKQNLRTPNPRAALKITMASSEPSAGIVGAAINAANIIQTVKKNS